MAEQKVEWTREGIAYVLQTDAHIYHVRKSREKGEIGMWAVYQDHNMLNHVAILDTLKEAKQVVENWFARDAQKLASEQAEAEQAEAIDTDQEQSEDPTGYMFPCLYCDGTGTVYSGGYTKPCPECDGFGFPIESDPVTKMVIEAVSEHDKAVEQLKTENARMKEQTEAQAETIRNLRREWANSTSYWMSEKTRLLKDQERDSAALVAAAKIIETLKVEVAELKANADKTSDVELEAVQAKLDAYKADKPDALDDNANDLIPEWMVKHLPDLYETEEVKGEDKIIWCKLFDPTGSRTWYVAEYRHSERLVFCYADGADFYGEWGYTSIEELEACKQGFSKSIKGLPIERDLYWSPTTFSEIKELK